MESLQINKDDIVIHKLSDRRYVAYFDKDHEGGETVEICGYSKFKDGYGYDKEELYKIINLKVGEVLHFISHPKINMEHHFILRVMDCGGFDNR